MPYSTNKVFGWGAWVNTTFTMIFLRPKTYHERTKSQHKILSIQSRKVQIFFCGDGNENEYEKHLVTIAL